jgi:hypothetical protein
MAMVQPPGDNARFIVVQRAGFSSMAFHPNWASNRYAYVVYTTSNLKKRLSRFTSTDGGLTLNAEVEGLADRANRGVHLGRKVLAKPLLAELSSTRP